MIPSKPAQEVQFSRKKKTKIHATISFNNIQVERASHHKHLDVLLDKKLNFKQHIDYYYLENKQRYISNQKTQPQFAKEILNDNLQSFFKAPD